VKPDVKVGQVWEDNDKRSKGRFIRVMRVGLRVALCGVWYDQCGRITPRRNVVIQLRRFRSNSTGYRLVQDVPAEPTREGR
jgi:hypothetical protein